MYGLIDCVEYTLIPNSQVDALGISSTTTKSPARASTTATWVDMYDNFPSTQLDIENISYSFGMCILHATFPIIQVATKENAIHFWYVYMANFLLHNALHFWHIL